MTQDEYVAKLKAQIDQWNSQLKDWEAKAAAAQDRLREQYLKQLGEVAAQRERVMVELRRVQGASMDAWHDLMRGADQAWKGMQEAFERARSEFNKK
jgi:putative component of toxin-antitoxin plasmid stabilization module